MSRRDGGAPRDGDSSHIAGTPDSGTTPRSRRRRILRVVAWITVCLVLLTAGAGAWVYTHLFRAIATVSLAGVKHQPAPAKADPQGNTPVNLLLLGSQTRDGQHGVNLGNSSKLGTNISDTAMLVHINAEKQWAVVVSIPRDLIAPRPECQGRNDPGVNVPAADAAMFDLAMNLGGPACAVATVEQMTGIRIDHFVEVTFNALQDLTDAVNGVTVCVPPPGINDPNYSGLVLSPGMHTVSGAQALEFVRDRHGVGDGSDLGRIQYQQMFVSSLFTKLTSNGTLSNPVTLYNIASAVTRNLTVDTGLKSLPALVSLAESVKNLKAHDIEMITAPYAYDPADVNRVIPGAGFDQVWEDLRKDQPLPGSTAAREFGTTAPSTAPAASSPAPATTVTGSGTPAPTPVPLSSLAVQVFNGTTTPDLATNAAATLTALGVRASVGGGDYIGYTRTEIDYPPGEQLAAQALATQVAGADLRQNSSVSALTLVLGDNAPAGLRTPPGTTGAAGSAGPTPTPSISAETRTGDQNICSSLPTPVDYGGHP
ncbi:LCP family protein [Streptacidiphilus sp. EB129]|uniref:LCP family protein n=1 Tax=Streptacidiphilus sp. EB129 TaxID=3156262 RepID=UPI003515A2CA